MSNLPILIALAALALFFNWRLTRMSDALNAAIAALAADVEAETTEIDSALALIANIPNVVSAAVADALANAGVDDSAATAAVKAAADAVTAETDKIKTALTANTPSA